MSYKFFDELSVNFSRDENSNAKLTIEPFNKGSGTTIGNSLRRMLMTSIPGAAISSIKIEGVHHEYTSIDGIKEDLVDIILNLKKIRFKMLDDGPEVISLNLQGPCDFNAGDMNSELTQFEVINKKLHIATITKKKNIEIEIRVQRGIGYSAAIENKRIDDHLETIQVDAIYNPITKVVWNVEPIPTSITGQERLHLEVESDGSTTPKDAINHAAYITRQHLAYFMFDDSSAIKALDDEELNEVLEMREVLSKNIDEMELSVRSHNCLMAAGIETIGELVSKDEATMLKYKNFGRKSLTELQFKLSELELKFGMDIEKFYNEETEK